MSYLRRSRTTTWTRARTRALRCKCGKRPALQSASSTRRCAPGRTRRPLFHRTHRTHLPQGPHLRSQTRHLPHRRRLRRHLRGLRRATTNLTPFTGTAGMVSASARTARTEPVADAVTPTGINTIATSKVPRAGATTRQTCGGSTFAGRITPSLPQPGLRGGPHRLPMEVTLANAPARQAAPVSLATHADELVTRGRHSTPREEKPSRLPASVFSA